MNLITLFAVGILVYFLVMALTDENFVAAICFSLLAQFFTLALFL